MNDEHREMLEGLRTTHHRVIEACRADLKRLATDEEPIEIGAAVATEGRDAKVHVITELLMTATMLRARADDLLGATVLLPTVKDSLMEAAAKLDTRAMDDIHALLDGDDWSADTAPAVAEIVERTGRKIAAPGGCDGCGGSGYLWPCGTNGDADHDWVERCDLCRRFDNDDAAADAIEKDLDAHTPYDRGLEIPAGLGTEHPYVDRLP